MSDIRNHALTTSWLGEQAFPAGAERVEFWGVDSETTPTAHAAVWVRLTDQAGETAPVLVSAGQTYEREVTKGDLSSWTYSIKAVSGTPDGIVVID